MVLFVTLKYTTNRIENDSNGLFLKPFYQEIKGKWLENTIYYPEKYYIIKQQKKLIGNSNFFKNYTLYW